MISSSYAAVQALSGNELVLAVALWLIFALLGYRISWRHQVLRGVTPWRFPSYVWAGICFAFGPVGLAVELLAEFTTKPRLPSSLGRVSFKDASAKAALRNGDTLSAQGRPMRAAGETFEETRRAVIEVEAPPKGPPAPVDNIGKTAIFGWYPDPLARHEKRYFDGRGWLDLVSDAGVRSSDPLEP